MKERTVRIACPVCQPGTRGKELPIGRVRQGRYGNCAACFRQMRVVREGKS